MAVRRDDVQLHVDFITDESRSLAKTLLSTKEYNREIDSSKAKIREYEKELARATTTEARRNELLAKTAAEEKKVADNLAKVAAEGKKVENIDLTKLAPAQLIERAKQLSQALRLIPASAPEFAQLQGELARVNSQIREINTTSKGIQAGGNAGFGALAGLATKVAVGIGAAVATVKTFFSSLSGSAKLEQLNIAFETFLGSADKAKGVIADLRKCADVPPFETEPVSQAGRALLAFGFSAEELIPTLTKVGDVASGTGKDFNELALIYGKARAEGRIQNDTLNQLAEAGIPIYQELAKVLKVNESQIRKLAEQGKIGFKDLQTVFTNLTSEGGRFAGLMERQSQSLDGLFSTLASTIRNKITNATNDLLPAIKELTRGFIDFLSTPVSETLEKERQAFNGTALAIANANVGSKDRTEAIRALQQQYPDFLGSIDAEKVTNEQLLPLLDQINKSYIVRIALQKQQEKIQPLLEAEANASLDLVEKRRQYNQQLARGAELSGVSRAAFQNEADFVLAVQTKLRDQIDKRGFSFFAKEDQVILSNILNQSKLIENATGRQGVASQKVAEAEKQRAEVVEGLKNVYGDLVDKVLNPATKAGDVKNLPVIDPETLKKQLDLALKAVEADAKRRELILENARIKDQISEERYLEGLTAIRERELRAQLEVYRRFGKDRENEALALRNRLAEIEQSRITKNAAPVAALPGRGPSQVATTTDNTAQRLEVADVGKDALLQALQDKFTSALISEQEYNLQKLELQRLALEQELEILRSASKPQADEIRKREEEKKVIEEKIGKERLENERRLEALKKQALQEGTQALGDVFSVAADLLSQDEKRKAKHAGVVKALQIAQIQVNLATEISGIFANAQQSAIAKLLGPVAGSVLAFVQAAAATVRAGIQSAKVQSAKFARGTIQYAETGIFGGRPHSQGGTKGYFDDGTVVEVEKDEAWAVVNKRNTPLLRALSWVNAYGGHGKPFFERGGALRFDTGGLPTVNTTPIGASVAPAQAENSQASLADFSAAVGDFKRIVAAFPREVRSKVVYTDVEDAGTEINLIRGDAAI